MICASIKSCIHSLIRFQMSWGRVGRTDIKAAHIGVARIRRLEHIWSPAAGQVECIFGHAITWCTPLANCSSFKDGDTQTHFIRLGTVISKWYSGVATTAYTCCAEAACAYRRHRLECLLSDLPKHLPPGMRGGPGIHFTRPSTCDITNHMCYVCRPSKPGHAGSKRIQQLCRLET